MFLLSYIGALLFFFVDGFQYFSYTTYQIPLLIIWYCVICTYASYILLMYIAFLIGVASVYTHGFFGVQLIPLAIVTCLAYCMHHFIYKKWIIPYCTYVLFICINSYIQQYLWHMPNYIEITYIHFIAWMGTLWLFGKIK
ncbi:MAG TPA: hypothetical protein VGW78_00515 [Candidatus Babeliales bacterium]|nr:hypothetical protein [Candidatus Babeliales bacterium]